MRALIKKIKSKEFIQNSLAEIIADIVMIVMGLVIGYYFKTFFL